MIHPRRLDFFRRKSGQVGKLSHVGRQDQFSRQRFQVDFLFLDSKESVSVHNELFRPLMQNRRNKLLRPFPAPKPRPHGKHIVSVPFFFKSRHHSRYEARSLHALVT